MVFRYKPEKRGKARRSGAGPTSCRGWLMVLVSRFEVGRFPSYSSAIKGKDDSETSPFLEK